MFESYNENNNNNNIVLKQKIFTNHWASMSYPSGFYSASHKN